VVVEDNATQLAELEKYGKSLIMLENYGNSL